jgi:hypothetical protein
MNRDVEDLLRDGMERFTAEVHAPVGLAGRAGRLHRLHRRRLAARATVACGAAAAIAAGVTFAATNGSAGSAESGVAQARTAAYITARVENALASENLVFAGRSHGNLWGNTVTWAYGSRSRFEEYWSKADARDRVVNGQRLWDFPPQDRGRPYLATGTALVHGKLVGAYVTYFDHRYSLSGLAPQPGSACSTNAALAMGAPLIPTTHWSAFISATLACGAAKVTGHVLVDGVETTQITGKPITVRLQPGYAKSVHAKFATVRWALYVNPKTYLPVRIDGSTQTYGGSAGSGTSSAVTNVQWLPATPANVAKALVTIPPGFHRFYGQAGNQ